MTIYIDIVFIENLIINFIIIYAISIILKINNNHIRTLISSTIGAIYAVIYYIIEINLYSNFIIKIILSIIMVYLAFNPSNLKTLFKQIIIFYLVSFVFAGGAIAIIYMANSQNIIIQNGMLIGRYTIKTILIGIIVAFIIIITGFKIVKTKISKKDLICEIKINLNDNTIKTNAMIDTGNFLKEPITNIPVAVVEHTLLYDVVPKEILNNLESVLGGDFSKIPTKIQEEYISKLKVIPFSSLGKQNGMLLGLKANELIVSNGDSKKEINKAIIGIYNKSLTKRGEYRALVGLWAS